MIPILSFKNLFMQTFTTRCRQHLKKWQTGLTGSNTMMMLFLMGSFFITAAVKSQQCNLLATNPDQAVNGGVGQPVLNPVQWINGNVNAQKAHYLEGQSIAYRTQITGLQPNVSASFTFCYDITKGSKHAIDFLTSPDRIVEAVQPLDGLDGYSSIRNTYLIPIPVVENTPVSTNPLYYD